MVTNVPPERNTHNDGLPSIPRPKLLFLAYYFPPHNSSGCVRTWNIAMYLARLGWDVTVVTPAPSVWRKVENSDKVSMQLEGEGIKRILTGHQWRCLMPNHLKCWDEGLGWLAGGVCRSVARNLEIDGHIGWVKAAGQACTSLSPKDVDIILASGAPFTAFRLAKRLADRLDRPYVLDYRDPWTGNPHRAGPSRLGIIQEEASLLEGCAAVTIVSPSWGVALDQAHSVGAKLHVVTNGYNPNEMADVKAQDFHHCAFVYTGNFYPPKRAISPFLAALKLFKENGGESGRNWYFHYYGVNGNHVREEANRLGLIDRIVLHGRVSQREALSAVKGASLAVVITSIEDEGVLEDKGIVTGKIFEAIGVGTPVLLIAPKGSDATTTTEATGLVKSFVGTDIHGMASFLKDVIRGKVPDRKNVEMFSWANIAKELDAVLRGAISGTAHA
ncbi:MAG TPA: glycosyltransferase [Nitrospira sp.]|nr:glycosyltransferase [Nitrospira sp.]